MNAKTNPNVICSRCRHTTNTKLIGEECDRDVNNKSLGHVKCGGYYNLTNGEKFKKQFGYSKSMKRNIKRTGATTVEEYREIRRRRKREQKEKLRKPPKVKETSDKKTKKK